MIQDLSKPSHGQQRKQLNGESATNKTDTMMKLGTCESTFRIFFILLIKNEKELPLT